MTSVALVTGSSRGLGLEFVRALLGRGCRVIATCRSPSKASKLASLSADLPDSAAAARLTILPLDVCDSKSIQAAAAAIQEHKLKVDLLINNAGTVSPAHPNEPFMKTDPDAFADVLQSNVIGPLRTIQGLYPVLKLPGAKIVNISSDLGSLSLNTLGDMCSYRCAKAALNQLTRNVAAEHHESVTCVSVHPGWVSTDMGDLGGMKAPLKPESSVAQILELVDSLTEDDSGKFFSYTGEELPW